MIKGQSGNERVTNSQIADTTGNTASMLADIGEEMARVGREYEILKKQMEDYFETLPPKHRDVMTLRFIFEFSTTKIGQMVDISQQHVSRIIIKNSCNV